MPVNLPSPSQSNRPEDEAGLPCPQIEQHLLREELKILLERERWSEQGCTIVNLPTGISSMGLGGISGPGTFLADFSNLACVFCPPGPPAKDEGLEAAYHQIGWWKGPEGSRERRRENQTFWAGVGEKGIRWLVARLRQERNIEVLNAAASLLASLGAVVVTPILDELSMRDLGDNGIALLGALGKISPTIGRSNFTRLFNTLRRYLNHPLLELREAAALATAILPADRAVQLLQDAFRAETNSVARETLREEIAERQQEQD
jgi:hypothetical protein